MGRQQYRSLQRDRRFVRRWPTAAVSAGIPDMRLAATSYGSICIRCGTWHSGRAVCTWRDGAAAPARRCGAPRAAAALTGAGVGWRHLSQSRHCSSTAGPPSDRVSAVLAVTRAGDRQKPGASQRTTVAFIIPSRVVLRMKRNAFALPFASVWCFRLRLRWADSEVCRKAVECAQSTAKNVSPKF